MKTLEPRDTYELIGHKQNEQFILKAWEKDKIPHALLLSGPKGVGKATFAFRIARFLLHTGDIDQNSQNALDFGQQITVAKHCRFQERPSSVGKLPITHIQIS